VENSGGYGMAQFRPFEMDSIPIEEQFMSWKDIVKAPSGSLWMRIRDTCNSDERD
jgi:hypothetical protein